MTNEWDAVIIGGSVAGLSAAQMLGRSRRRTLVIDGGRPRNRFAAHMHGVLGHDGLDPAALLEKGRAEARAYGVEIVEGTVTALTEDGDTLRVTRADGSHESARTVVIATGIRDALPDVPGLGEEWGRSVLHCPYCHGWEVAGGRLGVLAGSPASLHQIELVRQLSDDVVAFTAAAEPLGEETAARLAARGIRIVPSPVREVVPGADGLTVVTQDGEAHVVDAVFTGGDPVIDLAFADSLTLARADEPGAPLAVDLRGATSHPRVFAAGNVTAPYANVPVSMGAGSMAGAGANAMLVAEDFDRAAAERTARRNAEWEDRYAAHDRFWSGRVNATVAAIVKSLEPGTALDVGSGEGGDVVWLAEHGWQATGVDVSATAVRRATEFAATRGTEARFVHGDGAAAVEGEFDLVLASFLHSREADFPRIRMLRDAAERVAPGGHLLVVSHAAPPPWAVHESTEHHPVMRTPEEEWGLLGLDPEVWHPEIVEIRPRETTAPDGTPAHLDDGVLLVRRAAAASDAELPPLWPDPTAR
ncbi:bifunctional NAD(P)/FAD-dependent oxidoreductase/class I SAM-dependent methyltransferase [Microbacterium lushaniae]|uniref:NAD(P)/FAD-dependent oxidoreductase n=1 Tax=Microbacterium lushaniae TaxID=2614639 RepID=A0A5J6L1L4_9MICO|nr:bifunctional NAD(P)/FAD-dependent oxidoreductase/class I SAM-dependent methyltransferase [Microbacterium lushaniae]QEW02282.1 NAD(P)/FAD-dependent oxidoreductase [Microbacterium lushaniae]